MIKASLEPPMPVDAKLFNLILQSGKMQDVWCQGLITPTYKFGDKSDLTSILRKIKYYIIPANSQIVFLPEYRTADHVFNLRTLIDKYVHHHKGKDYACFVDFREAFE